MVLLVILERGKGTAPVLKIGPHSPRRKPFRGCARGP